MFCPSLQFSLSSGSSDTLTEVVVGAVEDITINSGGNPLPSPNVVSPSELADSTTGEGWESTLVKVENVEVAEAGLAGNEYAINDGLLVDDLLWDSGPVYVGDTMTGLTGLLFYSYDNFKISPRYEADVEGYVTAGCGADKCADELVSGDLVITEIMADPQNGDDDHCEWVEIYNASGGSVNLFGLKVGDNDSESKWGSVNSDVIVTDGHYAVINNSNATDRAAYCPNHASAYAVDGFHGGTFTFSNTGEGDPATLVTPSGVVVDTSALTGGTDTFSSQVLTATDNDNDSEWCEATTPLVENAGTVDYGTPGSANPSCN